MAITGLDTTFAVPNATGSVDLGMHATGVQSAGGGAMTKAQAPGHVWLLALVEVTVLLALIWLLGGIVFRSANRG